MTSILLTSLLGGLANCLRVITSLISGLSECFSLSSGKASSSLLSLCFSFSSAGKNFSSILSWSVSSGTLSWPIRPSISNFCLIFLDLPFIHRIQIAPHGEIRQQPCYFVYSNRMPLNPIRNKKNSRGKVIGRKQNVIWKEEIKLKLWLKKFPKSVW